jgi:hypothetical protein
MATADEYAKWIVDNSNKKGTADFDTVAKAYQEAKASETVQPQGFNVAKMLGNAPSSLYKNTIGGLYEAVSSPLQTGQALADVIAGGAYNVLPKPFQRGLAALEASPYNPLGNPAALQRAQNVAGAVGKDYATTYGTGEGFQRTMEEDPFRVVGDVSTLLAGAGAVGKAANLGRTANKVANALSTASNVTNPINMLLKPAASVVRGVSTSPQIQSLMKEGITPTVGQILGGGYKRAEEGLTSIPVLGDFIKNAQNRTMQNVNTAAFNRALNPIGESLPKGVVGREAVEFASDKLNDAYNNLLPKITVLQDTPFQTEISNLKKMVNGGAIEKSNKDFFNKWLNDNVLGKFQGQNAITGETLKGIQSDLRTKINDMAASTNNDERVIANALKETQKQLRELVVRSNPQYAKELKAIDTGYANFKRVERAAAGVGAEEGLFSPAQLQSAVKALDKSKDKSKFAKGEALMQDLSESAKTALGNKVPDSGTPFRSILAAIAGGVGASAAGFPEVASALSVLAASPLLYSKAGQNALATLMTKRPDFANALAAQLSGNEKAKLLALMAAKAGNIPRLEASGMTTDNPTGRFTQ